MSEPLDRTNIEAILLSLTSAAGEANDRIAKQDATIAELTDKVSRLESLMCRLLAEVPDHRGEVRAHGNESSASAYGGGRPPAPHGHSASVRGGGGSSSTFRFADESCESTYGGLGASVRGGGGSSSTVHFADGSRETTYGGLVAPVRGGESSATVRLAGGGTRHGLAPSSSSPFAFGPYGGGAVGGGAAVPHSISSSSSSSSAAGAVRRVQHPADQLRNLFSSSNNGHSSLTVGVVEDCSDSKTGF